MAVSQLSVPRFGVPLPSYTWFVAAIVAVWGVGDAASTLFALELTGSVHMEANPWIRLLLTEDPLLLPLFKGAVVAVAAAVLLRGRRFVESVPGWRLWFVSVIALGSLVVVTNVYVGLVTVA